MKIIKTCVLLQFIVLILFFSKMTFGLHENTHELINRKVAETTLPTGFSLNGYLVDQLDFAKGIDEEFNNENVRHWIELGGKYEDLPAWYYWRARSINHFHDPILNMGYNYGLDFGWSSIEWALMAQYTQNPGGYYSWNDVMGYYKNALTSPYQETRKYNFAETFRGLGQLMHLVQDASSPSHARNDQHPEYNYETWVRDNKSNVENFFAYTPIYFNGSMDSFYSGLADSIASFIDTNQYDGTNPDITAGTTIGLSEYANANFFSNDTNAIETTTYAYPRAADDLISDPTNIVLKKYITKDGESYIREYYKKTR